MNQMLFVFNRMTVRAKACEILLIIVLSIAVLVVYSEYFGMLAVSTNFTPFKQAAPEHRPSERLSATVFETAQWPPALPVVMALLGAKDPIRCASTFELFVTEFTRHWNNKTSARHFFAVALTRTVSRLGVLSDFGRQVIPPAKSANSFYLRCRCDVPTVVAATGTKTSGLLPALRNIERLTAVNADLRDAVFGWASEQPEAGALFHVTTPGTIQIWSVCAESWRELFLAEQTNLKFLHRQFYG